MTSSDLLPLLQPLLDSPYWAALTSTGWGGLLVLGVRHWLRVRRLPLIAAARKDLVMSLGRELGASLLADPDIQALIRQLLKQALIAAVKGASTAIDKDGDGVPDFTQRPRDIPGAAPFRGDKID